nr:hypothetical protein BaRGS_023105 [Batillaria attramentaria]
MANMAAERPNPGPPVGEAIDTTALFEKYTVNEIREREKKIRAEIEKKKEDLRVMVMKSISRMEDMCQTLQQKHMVKGAPYQQPVKTDNSKYFEQSCLQDIRSGVGKLLNYVNSVKRLADIRDAVWEILAQALIQYEMDTTAEMTKRSVSKVMMELASDVKDSSMTYEVDLGQFLWSEAVGDVQMNSVWQPAASRTLAESGGLIFKARAFTPAVHRLSMDGKLKSLLEDCQLYLRPAKDSTPTQGSDSGPFERYADTTIILQFCQVACSKCVQERKSRSVSKPADAPEWQAFTSKLDHCRMKSYKIWVEHIVSHVVADFTSVVTSGQHNNVIEKSTRFNKIGAHAFPRSVVREVLLKVLQGMIGAYESLLATRKKGSKSALPLSQQEALQELFNVKYMLDIMPWRDDTEANKAFQRRSQKVIEGLEEHVDPFDLDVFSPYIQSNLMKAAQRSASIDTPGASSLTAVVEATLPKNSSQSDLSTSFYDKLDRLGSMGSRLFSNIGGKS